MPPPPAPLNFWQRLRRALVFWRSKPDPVECTLLIPEGVLPGEVVNIQVICHHTRMAAEARKLQGWAGTERLPTPVERGTAAGLHVAVQGLTVDNGTRQFVWQGQSQGASFTVRVPRDWPANRPAEGAVTIGMNQVPVARLTFQLTIVAPTRIPV